MSIDSTKLPYTDPPTFRCPECGCVRELLPNDPERCFACHYGADKSLDAISDDKLREMIATFQPHMEGGQPLVSLHWDMWKRVLALTSTEQSERELVASSCMKMISDAIAEFGDQPEIAGNIIGDIVQQWDAGLVKQAFDESTAEGVYFTWMCENCSSPDRERRRTTEEAKCDGFAHLKRTKHGGFRLHRTAYSQSPSRFTAVDK